MTARFTTPTLAVALAITVAPAASACSYADASVAQVGPGKVARATRCVLNEARSAAGLRPLRARGTLRRTATDTAADMVRRGYFSHSPPEGTSLRTKLRSYIAPAARWSIGENLAYERGGAATARRVVRGWMRSKTHRATVLSRRFREVGIGVAAGTPAGEPGGTFAAHFGRRKLASRATAGRTPHCGRHRVRVKRRGTVRCARVRR